MPPQSCAFCKKYLCHLYWGCKGPCSIGGTGGCLQRLRDYKFRDEELVVVINHNEYESRILTDYLADKSVSIEDMWKACIDKLEAGTFKCFAYASTKGDMASCRMCARRILSDLAYQYRAAIPAKELPLSARMRPDGLPRDRCWYGRECRTQSKTHHAQNFDHIGDNIKKS